MKLTIASITPPPSGPNTHKHIIPLEYLLSLHRLWRDYVGVAGHLWRDYVDVAGRLWRDYDGVDGRVWKDFVDVDGRFWRDGVAGRQWNDGLLVLILEQHKLSELPHCWNCPSDYLVVFDVNTKLIIHYKLVCQFDHSCHSVLRTFITFRDSCTMDGNDSNLCEGDTSEFVSECDESDDSDESDHGMFNNTFYYSMHELSILV